MKKVLIILSILSLLFNTGFTNMGTKVADLYAQMRVDTGQLKTGLDSAKGQLKQFGSALSGMGLGGVAAFATIGGAIAGVTKIVSSSIKKTAEYSDQIRQLTRATGMSVQESAKMLNVADDMQVSFGDLTTAMRFSIQKGMLPTIDNLAKMSDGYLALNDPLLRSQMLIEQFGRNGLEMSKIMEMGSGKIKGIAAETQKYGMVIDQTGIQTMRDYELATNNMQDALKGLGIQLALTFAPAVTAASNGVSGYIERMNKQDTILRDAYKLYKQGALGLDDLNDAGNTWAIVTADVNDTINRLQPGLEKHGYTIDDNGRIISQAALMYQEYAHAVMGAKQAQDELSKATPAELPKAGAFGAGAKTIADIRTQWQEEDLGSRFVEGIINSIQIMHGKSEELATEWSRTASTITTKAQIMQGEISKSEGIKQLSKEFGITRRQAEKDIAGIKDPFMSLNGLQSYMDVIIRHWDVYMSGMTGVAAGHLSFSPEELAAANARHSKKAARGANFVVPPGYEHDSFPIFVESGEIVQVIPKSKVNTAMRNWAMPVNQLPQTNPVRMGVDIGGPSLPSTPYYTDPADIYSEYGNLPMKYANWKIYDPGALADAQRAKSGNYSTNYDRSALQSATKSMLADRRREMAMESTSSSVRQSANLAVSASSNATNQTNQQMRTLMAVNQQRDTKNAMVSGDMLAELRAMRKLLEKLPTNVRDAVLLTGRA